MSQAAALSSDGSAFKARAALLSLVGHGLAFGVAAAFVAAPPPPEPAPTYAVLFEMSAPPAPAVAPAPAPPVAETPVAEIALPPSPAKPPRPRAPRPPRPAISPAVAPAVAVAPPAVEAPAPQTAAIGQEPAPAARAAVIPAAAAPLPIPVVTDARFRERPHPPVYPRRAVELGLRGTAVLRCLVQPDGSTSQIVVWRSSGVETLDAAALGAVRQWRFEPARRDGDAIVAWVEIPVRFELN